MKTTLTSLAASGIIILKQPFMLMLDIAFFFQGYISISSRTGCNHLRQIRGDNYCAIRAVLFQALAGRIPILNLFACEEKTKLEKVCKDCTGTCATVKNTLLSCMRVN